MLHGLTNILFFQSVLDRRNGRLVVLVDDQAIPAKATMLLASRGMKIPSPHDLLAQTDRSQVRMITLKIPAPGSVLDRPYAYPAIRFGPGQPVAELQLEVTNLLVPHISKVTTASLVSISADYAIPDNPCILGVGGDWFPTGKRFAVKD